MWLLPSRRRPERCQRALDAFAAHGSTPGILYVHAVTPDEEAGYEDIQLPDGWVKHVGNGYRSNQCRYAQREAPGAEWFGLLSDDNYAETPGFDLAMAEVAVRGRFVCVNGGPEAKQWPSIPSCMMWGANLIDAVNWWAPPGIVHATMDEHWKRLTLAAGVIRYLPNVTVIHENWKRGLREKDFTDDEPRRHWINDMRKLEQFTREQIPETVQRIRDAGL